MRKATLIGFLVLLFVGAPLFVSLYEGRGAQNRVAYFAVLGCPGPNPEPAPEVTCCDMDGTCITTHTPCPAAYPFRDDPDPGSCMLSVQPQTGEPVVHVYERRASCILSTSGFGGDAGLRYNYALTPTSATLQDSLTSPVAIEVLENATNVLALYRAAVWLIPNFANDAALFATRDTTLQASAVLEPWEQGSSHARVRVTAFEVVIPEFSLYGVDFGPTTISSDGSAELPAPAGLVDPASGKFHLFIPFKVQNQYTGSQGVGPLWVAVYGAFDEGKIVFKGIHFSHPHNDMQWALGNACTTVARAVIAAIPQSEFKSPAHKVQLLDAIDGFQSEVLSIGNDRAGLATVHDRIDQTILPLVDGVVGEPASDDVMAPSGTRKARGLAYMAMHALHFYYYDYMGSPRTHDN